VAEPVAILLADDFPLPPEVVTESVAIIGRKGSGKTFTGGRLFEQMFKIGAQCVVLDPVGRWYGLRLAANGKSKGLDIPVFGGRYGDIPITPQGGKLMAQTIVGRGISCVIDLMNFRPTARKTFVTEFAEELYELKKSDSRPMHLFLEEARKFIPQTQRGKQDTKMIEAFEDIVRLGRNYGLGVSLIDQRPQSVNKEVLSQTEILIVHQLTEKLGRKEIEDWVRDKTTKGAEALGDLDKLHTGEAFVWSPGLLRSFSKVKVGKKSTYDSSSTPKVGEQRKGLTQPLSSKELEGIKTAMADMVVEAQANDPTALRARVRQLEGELARVPKVKEISIEVPHTVEVPVLDPEVVVLCGDLEARVQMGLSAIGTQVGAIAHVLTQFTSDITKRAAQKINAAFVKKLEANGHQRLSPAPTMVTRPHRDQAPAATGDLTRVELKILGALAWFEDLGIVTPPMEAVAFMAGYRPGGGAFGNPKGALRTKGMIDYPSSGMISLTDLGRKHAPPSELPRDARSLQAAVLAKLSGPEQRIMKPLLERWPNHIDNDELAAAAGYAPDGGAFGNPRGRLRTLGLLHYPSTGKVRAADLLFPRS
jgi:hypothetical protein